MVVVVLALAAAGCNAAASVLQRSAARRAPAEHSLRLGLVADLARCPSWLLGIAVMVGAFGLHALALARGPLSRVQPVLVTELLFVLALRAVVARRPLDPPKWAGAVVTTAGLAVFLAFASPRGGLRAPSLGHLGAVAAAAAAVVLGCLAAGRRTTGMGRAAFFGAAAGMAFALTAAFTKLMTTALAAHGLLGLLGTWTPYAVALVGAGSVFLAGNAFQAGSLVASQSALTVVDPLASIVVGVVLFGEHLHGGGLALGMECGAMTMVAIGVLLMSGPGPRDLGPPSAGGDLEQAPVPAPA